MLSTYTNSLNCANSLNCVNLLLEYNANIFSKNNLNFTALMGAACRNHTDICKLFVNKKCELEHTSQNGYTALLHAAEKGITNNDTSTISIIIMIIII